MAKNPPLKLFDKGNHSGILRIEQENLLGSNDCLNMLEIDNNGALTAEDCGRVRKQRVEDPEIAGRQPGSPHDGVLTDLHLLGPAGGVEEEPRPHSHRLLAEAADDGGRAEEGLPGPVFLRRRRHLLRRL